MLDTLTLHLNAIQQFSQAKTSPFERAHPHRLENLADAIESYTILLHHQKYF